MRCRAKETGSLFPVISGSRNPAERKAWLEGGLTAFFFADNWSNDSYWNQAADLVFWWSRIVLCARDHPTGHGFLIKKRARDFQQIYPVAK
jgi:hypothetical protein